ncbi:hypothetical protein CANMA_001219 [Candida margitis]|uniref:uncharacterized protein n=1 Tax=Candida margitis TaxID=1775924 RepID=UPI002225C89E|nr:uncharacterized protein CANMA_001219 [Candida margitis]KAI5969757.1 hypothetical protein CANMA_001219 [Candida margitis]
MYLKTSLNSKLKLAVGLNTDDDSIIATPKGLCLSHQFKEIFVFKSTADIMKVIPDYKPGNGIQLSHPVKWSTLIKHMSVPKSDPEENSASSPRVLENKLKHSPQVRYQKQAPSKKGSSSLFSPAKIH